ncbi:MAG: protein-export chaperone SecB [Candidatus Muiribacteriota bacterium]|jgi:preprotein translocase subunit SecB
MDKNDYNLFINEIDLKEVIVSKINYDFKNELFKNKIENKIEVDFDVNFESFSSSYKQKTLIVECPLKISLNFEKSKKNQNILELNVAYKVLFSLKNKPDEEILNFFYRNIVIFIIFPYFRELVNDITTKSGIPGIILPLIKIK